MNYRLICFLGMLPFFALAGISYATPDPYNGDSNVCTGSSANVLPNIMFLIDNSGAMKELGSVESYDSTVTYLGSYPSDQVYLRNVANENITNYQTTKFTYDKIKCLQIVDDDKDGYDDTTGLIHPGYALQENGFWYGALDSKGVCPTNDNQWENYFTGNYRNYSENIPTPQFLAIGDYAVGDVVKPLDGSTGLLLKCIVDGTSTGSIDPWPTVAGDTVVDGTVTWEALWTVMEMVQDQMENVVFREVRGLVNIGLMTFGDNNHGGAIIEPISETGLDDTDGPANYADLLAGLAQLDNLVNGNTQPVNESLWDAYLYWIGQSGSSDGIASDKVAYDSPIEYWCQSNHLIVLTTGSAGNNSITATKVGDTDGDGNDGLVDDVAKLMYDNLGLDIDGHSPKVHTHVIQLMTPYVQRLEFATDNTHGHGLYRRIENPDDLLDALQEIIAAVLEVDSSFVAPVVPASPENRAYSGQRIYLGFFKPMNDEPWYGNLKKFGLNSSSQITAFDVSGNLVKATDDNGYFLVNTDDNPTLSSFWNTTLDGGVVNAGGVGERLLTRTSNRAIYTWLGGTKDLNDSTNAFSTANNAISVSALGLSGGVDLDAANLINFIHGLDAYAQFSTDTAAKRPWILGDIMHSKPVVLNYSSFNPEADDDGDDVLEDADSDGVLNEDDPTVNDSYIFVGGNDGMLHAFSDVSGEEAWAFIPPDLLPNLQYLSDTDRHYYFVDSSPVIYVYDANGDGNVNGDDKVILLCGMRRGGGTSNITQPAGDDPPPSRGSYFALDVTNPEDPQFMWQINSEDVGFGEMGQTWSLPRLTKMNVGGVTKVVAVFGAGYDTNEDLRYGPNQNFPDDTSSLTNTSIAFSGEGDDTSAGTEIHAPEDSDSDAFLPRGRGVYIVEVATLTNGVPGFGTSGQFVWSYTNADNSAMSYCIPSDPLVLDRDNDGYTDHIYIGDTGGQLWRFNVADTETTNDWTGTRIFTANVDGSTDVGRKIFYKPTATVSGLDTLLYFGTGDREHPLNTAVVDRFYVVRDRESVDPPASPLTEDNLVDVTSDDLQSSTISAEAATTLRAKLTPPYYTDGTNVFYGWYIELDENDGEKVLANPKVFSGTVYFSTYEPASIDSSDDPCEGKLGPARFYAVNALTAEAVYNFSDYDPTSSDWNIISGDDEGLNRSDRSLRVGDGISSEPLIMINNKGAVSVMVGRGGGFFNSGTVESIDPVFPVYWMKW